ncbi:Uncharacterised protein [Suttonella ornithocola]|uniref:Uncharacterized protein n=1 Tax=Suttonella ornithocola TaxID=279832 RepID=A0A380MQW6_9GAMM|nr:Uncharacterised protein [Suttonella ornithocola]
MSLAFIQADEAQVANISKEKQTNVVYELKMFSYITNFPKNVYDVNPIYTETFAKKHKIEKFQILKIY